MGGCLRVGGWVGQWWWWEGDGEGCTGFVVCGGVGVGVDMRMHEHAREEESRQGVDESGREEQVWLHLPSRRGCACRCLVVSWHVPNHHRAPPRHSTARSPTSAAGVLSAVVAPESVSRTTLWTAYPATEVGSRGSTGLQVAAAESPNGAADALLAVCNSNSDPDTCTVV